MKLRKVITLCLQNERNGRGNRFYDYTLVFHFMCERNYRIAYMKARTANVHADYRTWAPNIRPSFLHRPNVAGSLSYLQSSTNISNERKRKIIYSSNVQMGF